MEDAHAVYPVTIDPLFTQIKKLTASDGVQDDNLGFAVSVDGDTAIIGAYGDDGFQGSAYIFQRNNGGADNWGQVKRSSPQTPQRVKSLAARWRSAATPLSLARTVTITSPARPTFFRETMAEPAIGAKSKDHRFGQQRS